MFNDWTVQDLNMVRWRTSSRFSPCWAARGGGRRRVRQVRRKAAAPL